MKTFTFRSIDRAEESATEAVALLRDLGAEIVDRCPANCQICGPVLDAAA